MSNALDFAKVFLKRGLDTNRDTYDGNMKLQKLLFFSNLVSIAEKGKPLFTDPIYAFSNGCVIENVRLRYKNDCKSLCDDSAAYDPDLTQDEYDVINLTADIFGKLSARELSELNHSFDFWKNAYEHSKQPDRYKDKNLAIVTYSEMQPEINKIKTVIDCFKSNKAERTLKEVVNGITFYYSPDMEITDDILEQLDIFSKSAEDESYSVYKENGELVIY